MTNAPGDPAENFGYAAALELVHRGRLDEARERARQASVNAGAGRRAGSIGDIMAAALTELLAAMPSTGFAGYDAEHQAQAEAIIDIALAARRPAWAAATRAIAGVGMVSQGRMEDALAALETAEVELAQEVAAGTTDPWGKPQGIAAGHNNLGYAYLLLQAYELALPHLTRALSISRWGYGPELSVQAEMDMFNLGELHLRWAIVLEAAGDTAGCLSHLEEVRDTAAALSRTHSGDPDGPWANAATVLRLGNTSLTSPGSLTLTDLALLQRTAQGESLTFLHNLANCLLARASRMLGDATTAAVAADRVAVACTKYDPMLVRTSAREAALAQAATDGTLAEFAAQSLRESQQTEQERLQFTAELQQRIAAALGT